MCCGSLVASCRTVFWGVTNRACAGGASSTGCAHVMVLVLTGSGYVVGSGVCTFAVATPVGTFDSAYAIAIAYTSAAVITRFAASVGVAMFVAAVSRGFAMSAGAAAAFVVAYGCVYVAAVAAIAVTSAVGSSAYLLSSSLCRSSVFIAAWSALSAGIRRVATALRIFAGHIGCVAPCGVGGVWLAIDVLFLAGATHKAVAGALASVGETLGVTARAPSAPAAAAAAAPALAVAASAVLAVATAAATAATVVVVTAFALGATPAFLAAAAETANSLYVLAVLWI